MLLRRSIEQFTQAAETENSDAARSETRLADPDIVCAVDCAILRVPGLQFLMHLVGLVHHVDIGDLPSAEFEDLTVVDPGQLFFLVAQTHRAGKVTLTLEISQIHGDLELSILDHDVEYPLVELESWLKVVSLNKLLPLAVLVQQKEASSVENGVTQQNCVYFLNGALGWVLADVAALQLAFILVAPLVVKYKLVFGCDLAHNVPTLLLKVERMLLEAAENRRPVKVVLEEVYLPLIGQVVAAGVKVEYIYAG